MRNAQLYLSIVSALYAARSEAQGTTAANGCALAAPGTPGRMKIMTRTSCKYGSLAAIALLLGDCSGGSSSAATGSGPGLSGGVTGIDVPTPVATTLKFVDLAVGLHHTAGLTAGAAVYCWGSIESGKP